jgi:hypothetical protein
VLMARACFDLAGDGSGHERSQLLERQASDESRPIIGGCYRFPDRKSRRVADVSPSATLRSRGCWRSPGRR